MFSYKRAMDIQRILSKKALELVEEAPPIDRSSLRYIVGVDAAYSHGLMHGVAVLLDYKTGMVLREAVVSRKPAIPYVPGLLAFREAPAYISAIKKLGVKPDLVFVDGHGLSHPRAFGIATHVGLVLDTPSIGVAKKKLFGEEVVRDGETYIYAHNHLVGKIIVHRGKKLYVSIGYKIRLEDAVEITEKMLKPQYKLPLPTALADQRSKKIAKRQNNNKNLRRKGP